MKIETCFVSPGQISPSAMSLICTTVPSAGERMSMWRCDPVRCGSRKKLTMKTTMTKKRMASVYDWSNSARARRRTNGMRKTHPSGARRIFGMRGDGMRDECRVPSGEERAEGRGARAEGKEARAEGKGPRAEGKDARAEGKGPRAEEPAASA